MNLDSVDVQGEDATDFYHQINVDASRSNIGDTESIYTNKIEQIGIGADK